MKATVDIKTALDEVNRRESSLAALQEMAALRQAGRIRDACVNAFETHARVSNRLESVAAGGHSDTCLLCG